MIKFRTYGGQHFGKDQKLWTYINDYNCEQNITIVESVYNSPIIPNRYIYIFIDINQKELFVKLNQNQKINDKNLENHTETIDSLKIKSEEITNKYFLSNSNFQRNKNQLNTLNTENNKLQKKIEENDKKEQERYQIDIETEKIIQIDIL